MADDLAKLPVAVALGRRARRIVRLNIALSLAIKGAFLGLAILGLASLWMAVAADMGASLLVTVNGLRLLSNRFGQALQVPEPSAETAGKAAAGPVR